MYTNNRLLHEFEFPKKTKTAPKESSDGESEEDIYTSGDSEEEVEEELEEEEEEEYVGPPSKGFTDDNKEWLKPKKLAGENIVLITRIRVVWMKVT